LDLDTLGKYHIVSKIGEGGMGEVYRAHDSVLGRDVAIKTMLARDEGPETAELRARFHREARSAARLNHPNIVTVHDFGEEKGRLFLAMELLEGRDLRDLLSRGEEADLLAQLGLMEQICDGLAFAHAHDIVHRDLKPGNIHVLPNGQVKIMDFGLARVSSSEVTRTGLILGTPNYMSPEQVQGQRATPRSDVFSLGAVFYELLAGRKAFHADALAAVLFQVMQTEPEPLEKLRPSLPDSLCALVRRALAKDPSARFAHAGEVREALREVRATVAPGSGALPGLPPSGTYPAVSSTAATGPAPGLEPTYLPTSTRPGPAAAPQALSTPAPVPPTQLLPTLAGDAPTRAPSRGLAAEKVVAARGARRAAAPRTGQRLVLAGAFAAVAVVSAWALWRPRPAGVEPPASPPSPTPAASALPPSAPAVAVAPTVAPTPAPRATVPPGQAATAAATRSLRERDYRSALSQAEEALRGDPGSAPARRVVAEARQALAAAQAVKDDLRRGLESKESARATQALTRLVSLDPRDPDLPALTARLDELVRAQSQEAARAREQALRAEATPPPFATPSPAVRPSPPPPAAQSETAARQAIRGVLDEYRAAFETRNADALRAVQPGVDYDAMKSVFATVTGYTVRIDVREVVVTGDSGLARCVVTYNPVPKPAGRIQPVPTTFHLRRRGDVWLIERLERN
jgi:serine/threonine-protein kinase